MSVQQTVYGRNPDAAIVRNAGAKTTRGGHGILSKVTCSSTMCRANHRHVKYFYMQKTKQSTNLSFSFNHTGKVDVTVSLCRVLPSVKFLNGQALGRASRASIQVGSVKGKSCVRTVMAVIESGIVTRLQMEPCGEMLRPTPEQEALIKVALKAAGKKLRPRWKPVPVAKFLANAQAYLIEGPLCIRMCILSYCVECCFTDFGSDDDPISIPYFCVAPIRREPYDPRPG